MIGGLIKSNRVAALAGAGFIASALAVSPAQAADLGGDCCADLEERVATLEATTARKGNRKVSLTVSGWVNSGLLVWDDGHDSDAYVTADNGTTLGSRIMFSGDAKINSDWSAGYRIVIEVQSADNLISGLNQTNDDTTNFGILDSFMFVKSEKLGKLGWGLQSHATDNISIADLSGTVFSGLPIVFEGLTFNLRNRDGSTIANATWLNVLNCGGIGMDCNGLKKNVIRYDSPTIGGFTLSASWGEDDFWDVALKYAGQFGDIKVAANAGYAELDNTDSPDGTETFEAAGSVMHVPTGIFVNVSYSSFETDSGSLDADAYYIKAGIKQKWNSLGATAIYGEYAEYSDNIVTQNATGGQITQAGVIGADVEVERFGVGIHQWVDAAAMQLYAKWDHLEIESSNADLDSNELDMFTAGAVIFF
jgi:predicted porin